MAERSENQVTADAESDLSNELARLKAELANLRDAIAERAGDVVQGASSAAQTVTQPIRNHPGTAGLVLGGLVGLLVGLAISQSEQRSRHWYDRYL